MTWTGGTLWLHPSGHVFYVSIGSSSMSGLSLRLADVLAALSVVTDLGTGQTPEKAVRACLVATKLACRMGASDSEARDVYYASLLRHLGCTASSHVEAFLFGGDELRSRPPGEQADFGNWRDMAALFASTAKGTGWHRPKYLARVLRAGSSTDALILEANCEVAARLVDRLELGAGVHSGVYEVFERWDGSGAPQGLAGAEISLPARLGEFAHQVVIFDRIDGPDAAIEMAQQRAGSWFDPEVCALFTEVGADLLSEMGTVDVWQMVLDAEPDPIVRIPEWRLDVVAHAFADMIDLKTPFTLGHSAEVGHLAAAAAKDLGLEPAEVDSVRRAGMLHDIGRAGVSNGVWEKTSSLHSTDWEKVRLHPYFTERVLSRSEALQPLARMAGMHHERQDGGGYHHAASGREIPVGARLIAAADAFQAMTSDRPHRPALLPEEAAEQLTADAAAGQLDRESTAAVLAVTGHRRPVTAPWPDELSDREVEVLRLVARGLSNKEIAEQLYVSRRTAEHHVQHIYTKVGFSTRAGLALYAMEHDLVRMQ